jgi:hypothetical protein
LIFVGVVECDFEQFVVIQIGCAISQIVDVKLHFDPHSVSGSQLLRRTLLAHALIFSLGRIAIAYTEC